MEFQKKSSSCRNESKTIQTIHDQCMQNNKPTDQNGIGLGYRHLIILMGFGACFFINMHRLSLSVTLVAMVNYTLVSKEVTMNSSACFTNVSKPSVSKQNINGDFNWSSEVQGYIFGMNFLGYIITQLPAGRLAEVWSIKYTFILGNALGSCFMFIIPFVSWYHAYAVVAVQFLRGLSQGLLLPCVYAMMAKWCPRVERTLLSTLVMSGYSFGASLGGMFSGWMCDLSYFGWPYVFYFSGLFNMVFVIFFAVYFYETPENHPKISEKELNFILHGRAADTSKKLSLPWKSILRSVPFYALLISLFGDYWAMSYFASVHPIYMGTILNFGMTQNGIFSSMPILLKMVAAIVTSIISTWLLKKKYVGIDRLRKSCNSIGFLGLCGCLLGVYLIGCDATGNVFFFAFALVFNGIAQAGSMIVCIDMSPTFAGSLSGFVTSFASIALVILPIVVGQLTKNQTLEEWHATFFISIAVIFFSAFVFQFFGSAEVQPWNYANNKDRKSVDNT